MQFIVYLLLLKARVTNYLAICTTLHCIDLLNFFITFLIFEGWGILCSLEGTVWTHAPHSPMHRHQRDKAWMSWKMTRNQGGWKYHLDVTTWGQRQVWERQEPCQAPPPRTFDVILWLNSPTYLWCNTIIVTLTSPMLFWCNTIIV